MRFFLLIFCAVLALACKTDTTQIRPNVNNNSSINKTVAANSSNQSISSGIPVYTYEVVNTYKHDSKAFTEGLFFLNGFLYESVGLEGMSSLRKTDLNSGKILQKYDLPRDVFAEGISVLDGKIYQLTYRTENGYVYDAETFKLLRQFNYQGEGWGLTNDGKNLIMTDGTHVIRFIEPETFQTVRSIIVFGEDGKPLMNLNELEFINGEIWANVWHSEKINKPNHIARIDPTTGKLLGWINLDGISPDDVERGEENTMNGIAYDRATDKIFVTGKNWKKLFEIKVKPKE